MLSSDRSPSGGTSAFSLPLNDCATHAYGDAACLLPLIHQLMEESKMRLCHDQEVLQANFDTLMQHIESVRARIRAVEDQLCEGASGGDATNYMTPQTHRCPSLVQEASRNNFSDGFEIGNLGLGERMAAEPPNPPVAAENVWAFDSTPKGIPLAASGIAPSSSFPTSTGAAPPLWTPSGASLLSSQMRSEAPNEKRLDTMCHISLDPAAVMTSDNLAKRTATDTPSKSHGLGVSFTGFSPSALSGHKSSASTQFSRSPATGYSQAAPGTPNGSGVGMTENKSTAEDPLSSELLRRFKDLPATKKYKVVYRDERPCVLRMDAGLGSMVSGNMCEETLPADWGIYADESWQVLVEFKRHRVLRYESSDYIHPGNYVLVGADRGEDLGVVICCWCASVKGDRGALARGGSSNNLTSPASSVGAPSIVGIQGMWLEGAWLPNVLQETAGRVLRLAIGDEVQQLHEQQFELERRACEVCQQKVLERKVPLVIVDTEYQFDSKKLTVFYEAQQRTDFRELVRDLYKSFRARIWMQLVEDTDLIEAVL